MKLRNKRTGDVWEFDGISMAISDSTKEKLGARGCSGSCYARSLSDLNEEWEDYTPAEPLIKDEKVRKVVRAWARANNSTMFIVGIDKDSFALQGAVSRDEYENDIWYAISFYGKNDSLKQGRSYTIAELCGEEEE